MKTGDEKLKAYLQERLGGYSYPVDESLLPSLMKTIPPVRSRKRLLLLVVSGISAALIAMAVVFFTGKEKDGHITAPLISGSEVLSYDQADQSAPDNDLMVDADDDIIGPASEKPSGLPESRPQRKEFIAEAVGQVTEQEKDLVRDTINPGISTTEGRDYEEKEAVAEAVGYNNDPGSPLNTGTGPAGNDPRIRSKRKNNTSLLLAMNGRGLSGAGEEEPDLVTGLPPIFGNDGQPIDPDDATYAYPWSFSLTVRKNILPRLALETGLNYSYLHTMVSKSGTDITLHYLGIPLKATYTIVDWRRLSLYGGAHGMVERQVAGKLQDRKGSRNLITSRLQWSVGASAGLEVTLAGPIGLFAEPGVVYYFDDGSNIPTIRKDKPLNFSLQIGLRFNIK